MFSQPPTHQCPTPTLLTSSPSLPHAGSNLQGGVNSTIHVSTTLIYISSIDLKSFNTPFHSSTTTFCAELMASNYLTDAGRGVLLTHGRCCRLSSSANLLMIQQKQRGVIPLAEIHHNPHAIHGIT
jgi:hypothetical protein